jgi:hypothetical protein
MGCPHRMGRSLHRNVHSCVVLQQIDGLPSIQSLGSESSRSPLAAATRGCSAAVNSAGGQSCANPKPTSADLAFSSPKRTVEFIRRLLK